jgi:WD40 repeat protein
MSTLDHRQAQALLSSGRLLSPEERADLAVHLASCPDCREFARFHQDLVEALPQVYPARPHSEVEIRRKASVVQSSLERKAMLTRITHHTRTAVSLGISLIVLVALVALLPRLLPGGKIPSGIPINPSATRNAIPAPILSLTATPTENSPTPTQPPADPSKALELGQPKWIGRGQIVDAEFLPGGKQIAIAWGSGVSLNSVQTGQELWFQYAPTNVIAFDLQPQGEQLAALLTDGSIMVMDTGTGKARTIAGKQLSAPLGDIAWSPDGRVVAFQFITNPIDLLDLQTGQVTEIPNTRISESYPPLLTWSPDGSALTMISTEACLRFIDVKTGQTLMRLSSSEGCYLVPAPVFLPDGKTVVVQNGMSKLDLLSFPDGGLIQTLESSNLIGRLIPFQAANRPLFVDPKGQWVASRGGFEPCYCDKPDDQPDHPLVIWNLASGAVRIHTEELRQSHRLAATFDGDSILMLYESGEITRWAFTEPGAQESVIGLVPSMPFGGSNTLRWSVDGSRLAYTGKYGGIDVYDTATGQLVHHFLPSQDTPAFSPGGRLAALFNSVEKTEVVYDLDSMNILQTLPASRTLMGPAFSPDGQFLAYGDGNQARVADLASGSVESLKPAADLVPASLSLTRLIWSPGGEALVTVFGDGSAGSVCPGVSILWQRSGAGSWEEIYHVSDVQACYDLPELALAAFNPSGSRVALQILPALEAGQMQLAVFDLQTRKVIQTYPDYSLNLWVNDDVLLATEAQYDVRQTQINVIDGTKVQGAGTNGSSVYAPNGLYSIQMTNIGPAIMYWRSRDAIARIGNPAGDGFYSWSPDGGWILCTGSDGTILLWKVIWH